MHSRPVPGGERSVSPVVGTVLFVAIVVILGAVAAAFAFGLSDDPAVAPQTAFGFEYDADTDAVTLEVKQGDAIDGSDTRRLVVRVDGGSGDGRKTWAKRGGGVVDLETDALAAGDSLTVDDASGADTGDVTLSFEMESGDTVEVLWVARDGDGDDST